MSKKTILYLRTDLNYDELVAGGSVGHTIGVIQGFIDNGFDVVCASTCMINQLKQLPLKKTIFISKPPFLRLIRWRLGSLVQSIKAFFIINNRDIKNSNVIYQRYTLLSITGLLLAWWYTKKLIIEYNGSEYWMLNNWGVKKRFQFLWLVKIVENLNLKNASTIIVISDVLKKELVERGINHNKILVTPNGVNEKKFSYV